MPPNKMRELARRIAGPGPPEQGRDVWLTPATALLVARILSARATLPMRWKIIAAMCNIPHCKSRRDCMECIMKANAVERMYDEEYAFIVKCRADE